MRAWKASPQLLQLLKAVESDLQKVTDQAGRRPEGPYAEVLPFLVSQRQDWEQYAAASQASTTQVKHWLRAGLTLCSPCSGIKGQDPG